MTKQIVYRKITIPAGVQPFNNDAYNLIIDKGTEEMTLMFTRPPSGSYNIYVITKTPYSIGRETPNQFGETTLSSSAAHTFKTPTLFHKGLTWTCYIDPPQSFDIVVEYFCLRDTDSYLYN